MAATKRWIDPAIQEFQRSGGTHPQFGRVLVLVHGRGARSGEPRPNLVRGIPFRDGWVVAATFGGEQNDPAWVRNLRAHPDVEVEVPNPDRGVTTHAVRAVELADEDREEARRLFLRTSPAFASLEARSGRHVPIFALERR
jgi:deazaflavin-dependent oxidoreductase (nitroreductase family)